MMISTKRPTVADARKITLFRNIPRENHVTCRFPYRQQDTCVLFTNRFPNTSGVYTTRDDCRSSCLQNKYVKPQCYEFDFNMISGLPAIVKNVYDYYFTG